jgi:hypothetical protein
MRIGEYALVSKFKHFFVPLLDIKSAERYQKSGLVHIQAYKKTSCATGFTLCSGDNLYKKLDFLPISKISNVTSSEEYACAVLSYKLENKEAVSIKLIAVNCTEKYVCFCEFKE